MFGLYKKWKPKFFTKRITIPEFGGANGLSVCVVRGNKVSTARIVLFSNELIQEFREATDHLYGRSGSPKKRTLFKKLESRRRSLRKKRKAKKAHR